MAAEVSRSGAEPVAPAARAASLPWIPIFVTTLVAAVLALAILAWLKVPNLYPETFSANDDAAARATRDASRNQSIVTTRASVLAALAGLGALLTIGINYRNARTQLEALRETARSYAAAEVDRARDIELRETSAKQAADDAMERRITEIYTASVEQLGAEKAPVRLGGLYALERLAQATPSQRQTIVNVWCAYLRMPFAESWEPPSRDDSETPENAASVSELRRRREELEVRLTAQRLLASHLRPGPDQTDWDQTYWPEARELDLREAYLVDLDLSQCRLPRLQIDGAELAGRAHFTGATFTENMTFDRTSFAGEIADFTRIISEAEMDFSGSSPPPRLHFHGADISAITFEGASLNSIHFDEAVLRSFSLKNAEVADASFRETRFDGQANFVRAAFGSGRFNRAQFNFLTLFSFARFSKSADFEEAVFADDADLDGVIFNGDVYVGVDDYRNEGAGPGTRIRSDRRVHLPLSWEARPSEEEGWLELRRIR